MSEKDNKDEVVYTLNEGKDEREYKDDIKVSLKIAVILGTIILILIGIIVVIGIKFYKMAYLDIEPHVYYNHDIYPEDFPGKDRRHKGDIPENDYSYEDDEDSELTIVDEIQMSVEYVFDLLCSYSRNPNLIVKDFSDYLIDFDKLEASDPNYIKYSCNYNDFMKEFMKENYMDFTADLIKNYEDFKDVIKADKDGKLLIKKTEDKSKDWEYDTTIGSVTILEDKDDLMTIEAKYIIDICDKDYNEIDSEYGDVTFKVKKTKFSDYIQYDDFKGDIDSEEYSNIVNEEYKKYYKDVYGIDYDSDEYDEDDYYDEEDPEIEDEEDESYIYLVQSIKVNKAGNKNTKNTTNINNSVNTNKIENSIPMN